MTSQPVSKPDNVLQLRAADAALSIPLTAAAIFCLCFAPCFCNYVPNFNQNIPDTRQY